MCEGQFCEFRAIAQFLIQLIGFLFGVHDDVSDQHFLSQLRESNLGFIHFQNSRLIHFLCDEVFNQNVSENTLPRCLKTMLGTFPLIETALQSFLGQKFLVDQLVKDLSKDRIIEFQTITDINFTLRGGLDFYFSSKDWLTIHDGSNRRTHAYRCA